MRKVISIILVIMFSFLFIISDSKAVVRIYPTNSYIHLPGNNLTFYPGDEFEVEVLADVNEHQVLKTEEIYESKLTGKFYLPDGVSLKGSTYTVVPYTMRLERYETDNYYYYDRYYKNFLIKIDENIQPGNYIIDVACDIGGDNIHPISITVKQRGQLALTAELKNYLVKENDTIEYDLSITNRADEAINNVLLEQELSEFVTIESVSENYTIEDGKYIIKIPKMEANEVKKITVKLKVKKAEVNTEIVNKAYITADNYSKKGLSMTSIVKKANIEIINNFNKDDALKTDNYSYQVIVKNTGEVKDNNVSIKLPVDEDFKITSASNGGKIENNIITWNIDEINPGEAQTFNISVKKAKEEVTVSPEPSNPEPRPNPDDTTKEPSGDTNNSKEDIKKEQDTNNHDTPKNPNTAADGWKYVFLLAIPAVIFYIVIRKKNKNYFFKV